MATVLLSSAAATGAASLGWGAAGVFAARAAGSVLGSVIDQRIAAELQPGLPTVKREGPRLDSLDVMTSAAGQSLADVSGRTAIAGAVIWATRIKETITTDRDKVKTGKNSSQKVETTSYSYSCSFAVALGEGPLVHWGRVWADGKLIDLSSLIASDRVRFYPGTETQDPDPLIAAIEGAAPAFRGVAYIVFQDFELADYGNRVPQIKVEVWGQSGTMETLVRGVNAIPGSTEWGYDPQVADVVSYTGTMQVKSRDPLNAVRHGGVSDWSLSMDMLGAVLPNADTVSLVVAWFGDDLRAGHCRIMPRVEYMQRVSDPQWIAAGLTYYSDDFAALSDDWSDVGFQALPRAPEVSTVDGQPAFGSSPSDASVVRAIQDLKARGKRVVLYPFIMMDVQAAQALPDPSGVGGQADYPWRGRIAPTVGADVATEIDTFTEGAWGFRAFITHLAGLAASAGGVDAFLIGSELRGLTMAHAGGGSFPFVDKLKSIAADVRAILPSAEISYAADWSEYHSFRVGSDVFFHLDPLWSDANIDFVGIDNYFPVADWRDTPDHLDRDDAAGITSTYHLDYLKANIEGGEGFHWYYATEADRDAQNRTPIFDAAHGEDWVFRQKAVRDWHGNAHRNRPGGVRDATPTAWVPGSKPVWFTELGCPAVDKGANQPNVFASRTSSESALPYHSNGVRDDFMQRQFLRAVIEWWADNGAGVVDVANIQVWAWDVRPFPEFPQRTGVWADGPDWYLGHWLNGRAGAAPVAEAITRRAIGRHGLDPSSLDVSRAYGQADGYAAPGPLGFRDYVQPFEVGLGLQSYEADGQIVFEDRAAMPIADPVALDDMSELGDAAPFTLTRSALEDVAAAAVLKFRNGSDDYEIAAARAVIGAGFEEGEASAESALVMDFDRGNAAAERMIRSARDGREAITFRLPRSATHVRPGVVVPVVIGGVPRPYAVETVTDGIDKAVTARSFAAGAWVASGGVVALSKAAPSRGSGALLLGFLDLPILPGITSDDWDGFVAVHCDPWGGAVVASRSSDPAGGFLDPVGISAPATMGETLSELAPDLPGYWSPGTVDVQVYSGTLTPRDPVDVLEGRNLLAVEHPGGWEVLRFTGAEILPGGAGRYRLSGLLRGDRGTEAIADPVAALPATATVVLLDGAMTPVGLAASDVGRALNWRYGRAVDDIADHAVEAHTFAGVGLRPFAPAALAGSVTSGDLSLSWVRRSRAIATTLGDTPSDPPLSEASELYRVEIGPAGAPVRTFEVTSPAAIYTAAQRSSDGIAAPFRVAVAQVSETFGPGSWAETLILE